MKAMHRGRVETTQMRMLKCVEGGVTELDKTRNGHGPYYS